LWKRIQRFSQFRTRLDTAFNELFVTSHNAMPQTEPIIISTVQCYNRRKLVIYKFRCILRFWGGNCHCNYLDFALRVFRYVFIRWKIG
jgi:hypothetical protein